mmetsp:Transcript_9561/g.32604  ORF Transcript_9561/g.32604 Transcript_9561/m.32604 type:complete len:312 (-) Transcript_9561:638-1573(-)
MWRLSGSTWRTSSWHWLRLLLAEHAKSHMYWCKKSRAARSAGSNSKGSEGCWPEAENAPGWSNCPGAPPGGHAPWPSPVNAPPPPGGCVGPAGGSPGCPGMSTGARGCSGVWGLPIRGLKTIVRPSSRMVGSASSGHARTTRQPSSCNVNGPSAVSSWWPAELVCEPRVPRPGEKSLLATSEPALVVADLGLLLLPLLVASLQFPPGLQAPVGRVGAAAAAAAAGTNRPGAPASPAVTIMGTLSWTWPDEARGGAAAASSGGSPSCMDCMAVSGTSAPQAGDAAGWRECAAGGEGGATAMRCSRSTVAWWT